MNEQLNSFLIEVQTHMSKTNEKLNAMCTQLDKLEERFVNMEIKIEANKLVYNEKNESNNYKLSVLEEKINANNQKVNDLNNILMKHFAYKNLKNNTVPPSTVPQSTVPPSTVPPTAINPFSIQNFNNK
jgi:uncharacterized coiled-coil protein SlyX